MRKHREKRKQDRNFDIEKHHENECKRISKLRNKQKYERENDPKLLRELRKKETLRKRKQRENKKSSHEIYRKKQKGLNDRRKTKSEMKKKINDFYLAD